MSLWDSDDSAEWRRLCQVSYEQVITILGGGGGRKPEKMGPKMQNTKPVITKIQLVQICS